MNISALIAVRGGSVRVTNKNTRPFAYSSLLDRKIVQLKSLFDTVVVNTDDEVCKRVAEAYHCHVIRREDGLSDACMSDVYRSMAEQHPTEHIAYCNATSPLIKDQTILDCTRRYREIQGSVSVNTVANVRRFMWMHNSPLNYTPASQPRSQDLPDITYLTFACSIISRDDMVRLGNVVTEQPVFVRTSDLEAIDIDTPLDFDIAEFLCRRQGR